MVNQLFLQLQKSVYRKTYNCIKQKRGEIFNYGRLLCRGDFNVGMEDPSIKTFVITLILVSDK